MFKGSCLILRTQALQVCKSELVGQFLGSLVPRDHAYSVSGNAVDITERWSHKVLGLV